MPNSKGIMRKLAKYIFQYKLRLFISLTCVLLMTVSSVLQPYIIGLAITGIGKDLMEVHAGLRSGIDFRYLGKILLLIFFNGITNVLTNFFSLSLMADIVQKSMRDLRRDISLKINRIAVSYFDSNKLGDILSRVTNDVDTISNALQQGAVNIMLNVLSILASILMMTIFSLKFSLLILAAILLNFLLGKYIIKFSQPIFQKQANALGSLFGFVQEQLSGQAEICAFNKEELSFEVFVQKNKKLFLLGRNSTFFSQIISPLSSLVLNLAYIVVFYIGAKMVYAGLFTIGNLQAFISYVGNIKGAINSSTGLIPLLQAASASGKRIFDFLETQEMPSELQCEKLPQKVNGAVEFRHVAFGYRQDKKLMRDVSFKVNPGEKVAIVGPTGAGKTTLVNLLMRFYEVDQGEIYIDGINIKEVNKADLRSHMGMVLQDARLFAGTVMENIRFGKLTAGDMEVREACRIANVDSFIKTLPGTYEMKITEGGANVSQGQRQLMTIARALLAAPDILILDEATSSVDTRLERLIQEAMDRATEGRTSFIIAHRLSTIKNADLILVLQDGDIIETGNHAELIARKGFYYDLYNAQFKQAEEPADIHITY